MTRRRISIEPDDAEVHGFKRGQDLTGQVVTVRLEDGTEVQGHAFKFKEDVTGDDEGRAIRNRGIDIEVDDAEAHLLIAANERGEPVFVRFPDGVEVQGHAVKFR